MFKYYMSKNFNTIFKNNTQNIGSAIRNNLCMNLLKFNFFTKVKSNNNCLIKYQKFEMRSLKSKRKAKSPDPKYKMKTKNSLIKRIKIVGRLLDRGFKFWSPGKRHKMTNKSKRNLLSKRKSKYISKCDIKRVKIMLPYFRRKKYKH